MVASQEDISLFTAIAPREREDAQDVRMAQMKPVLGFIS